MFPVHPFLFPIHCLVSTAHDLLIAVVAGRIGGVSCGNAQPEGVRLGKFSEVGTVGVHFPDLFLEHMVELFQVVLAFLVQQGNEFVTAHPVYLIIDGSHALCGALQQHISAGVAVGVVGGFQQVQIHGDDAGLFQHAFSGIPFQGIAVAHFGELVCVGDLLQKPGFPFPVDLIHQLADAVDHSKRQVEQYAGADDKGLVAQGGDKNEEDHISADKAEQEYDADAVEPLHFPVVSNHQKNGDHCQNAQCGGK